ncbi:MAG: PQQ-binding-like beta-propeller repeat protein, partial [Phycisphaerae bacterium]
MTTRKCGRNIGVLLCVGAVTAGLGWSADIQPSAKSLAPVAQVVPAPSGEYRAARITLEQLPYAGKGVDYHLDGAFRDGRMPVLGRHSHQNVVGHLDLKGTSITSPVVFGRNKPASMRVPSADDFDLTITAEVAADGSVTGTYSGTMRKGMNQTAPTSEVKGKISGFVRSEAQLAALQKGFASGADWPSWAGPRGSLRATSTPAVLVDDLAKARLLWRSEASLPQGPGSLFTLRSPGDAMDSRLGGGGASPIVADGRVFLNFYEPNRASGESIRDFSVFEKIKQARVKEGTWTDFELHPDTKAILCPRADQVMICIDASTGKTLWKTVIPDAGINLQSHKSGTMNCTAFAGDGRVLAMDVGGKINALDAKTGQLLWSTKVADAQPGTRAFNQGVIGIGGVIIAGDQQTTLFGLEAASGKILWKIPGGTHPTFSMAVPWTKDGKDYALSYGPAAIHLIDPPTGKILWSLPMTGNPGKFITVHQDTAFVYRGVAAQNGAADEDGDSKKDPLVCLAIHMATEKASELWSFPCVDIANGNIAPLPSPEGRVCIAGTNNVTLLDART